MVVRQRVVPDVSGRAWPLVRDVGDWVGGGRPLSVILRRWWSRMVSGGMRYAGDWRGFVVFRDGLEPVVVVEVGGP